MAELKRYLELGRSERRDLEYKQGESWKSLANNVTKAALAMANLEGGGYIVIGISEDGSDGYSLTGMTERDANTYKQDEVSEFMNKYADPHIQVDVKKFAAGEGNSAERVVVVQVLEFEEVPVICKKDSGDLQQGCIYSRPHRKNESTPQLTAFELREIIESAVDKGIRKQRKRVESYTRDGVDPFEQERGAF